MSRRGMQRRPTGLALPLAGPLHQLATAARPMMQALGLQRTLRIANMGFASSCPRPLHGL